MIQLVIAGISLLLFGGTFLISYIKSKGQYDEYLEPLDKDEYGLKDIIPLGVWLGESGLKEKLLPKVLVNMLAQYNNRLYGKVFQIRGVTYAKFYAMIHQGYRTGMGLSAAAFLSLIGFVMGAQGDGENALIFTAMALAAALGLPFLMDSSLDEQVKKKTLSIQMEFPEFVSKLTLLVNAGMTISKAWEKIIVENKKDLPLYAEMKYAYAEIQAGRPEAAAYEEFARRCRVKEVTRFVSVVIMNLRRGGADVVPVLRAQGDECWEMRKMAARQMGEEASAKLMIPLMIMFVGIILIVATPAMLSFNMGM